MNVGPRWKSLTKNGQAKILERILSAIAASTAAQVLVMSRLSP